MQEPDNVWEFFSLSPEGTHQFVVLFGGPVQFGEPTYAPIQVHGATGSFAHEPLKEATTSCGQGTCTA